MYGSHYEIGDNKRDSLPDLRQYQKQVISFSFPKLTVIFPFSSRYVQIPSMYTKCAHVTSIVQVSSPLKGKNNVNQSTNSIVNHYPGLIFKTGDL